MSTGQRSRNKTGGGSFSKEAMSAHRVVLYLRIRNTYALIYAHSLTNGMLPETVRHDIISIVKPFEND